MCLNPKQSASTLSIVPFPASPAPSSTNPIRTKDSGLLCVNLVEGLGLDRQPRLLNSFGMPSPPMPLNTCAAALKPAGGTCRAEQA